MENQKKEEINKKGLYFTIGCYVIGLILCVIGALMASRFTNDDIAVSLLVFLGVILMGISSVKSTYRLLMKKHDRDGFIYDKKKNQRYYIEQNGYFITAIKKYDLILFFSLMLGGAITPVLIIKEVLKNKKIKESQEIINR